MHQIALVFSGHVFGGESALNGWFVWANYSYSATTNVELDGAETIFMYDSFSDNPVIQVFVNYQNVSADFLVRFPLYNATQIHSRVKVEKYKLMEIQPDEESEEKEPSAFMLWIPKAR